MQFNIVSTVCVVGATVWDGDYAGGGFSDPNGRGAKTRSCEHFHSGTCLHLHSANLDKCPVL